MFWTKKVKKLEAEDFIIALLLGSTIGPLAFLVGRIVDGKNID
jgi:hypothetical protein